MTPTSRIPIIAAALALAAPAAASADVLATADGSQVARYAGTQAWSQAQGKDRFVLMIRSGGRTARAAAGAQRTPFLVTLGVDGRGRRIALYPRCTTPAPTQARGTCRLVSYDVAARRERALPGVHAPGASEEAAVLDRGILAFARRTGRRSTVLIRRLGSGRPARVAARIPDEAYVTGISLSHRALAFSADAFPTETGESRMYVKPAGRVARQVARGGFGEENSRVHRSPSIAGTHLYWAYANQSEVVPANGWVARCDLRTGRTTAARAPGYLDAVAADPARPSSPLVVSSFSQTTDAVQGTDQVATLDDPAWQRAPAALGLIRGFCGR
jgi:hypothetical protein